MRGSTLGRIAPAVAVVLTGCAYAVTPVFGAIYYKVQAPVTATNETSVTKTGRACAESILGIVGIGDASIDAAKRAGGITTVTSVDVESKNILFVYATYCTIVRGT